MAVDVTQAIQDFIARILNDRETAVQYSEDPGGVLAAQGITEGDMSNLYMFQVVSDTCGSVPGLRDYGPSSGGSGGGGGGASGGAPTPPPASSPGHSVDQVIQHMNYVTYETYKNDETIVNNIDNSTNIDQSQNTDVDIDVEGDLHGGVDVDVDSHDTNVNATGDGSAASGDGPAVSGDGSAVSGDGPAVVGDENLINTGTNLGQQNTGDEAAQAIQVGFGRGEGGGIVQNTGDGGVAAGGNIDGPINTGEFTGIQSEGDVDIDDSALGFGEGNTSNVSDIDASEGGAVAVGGGDATGVKNDNDQTNLDLDIEVTNIDADDSIVQTEQGPGDASQDDLVDLGAVRQPAEVLDVAPLSAESDEPLDG
jgi:hypothetical protein